MLLGIIIILCIIAYIIHYNIKKMEKQNNKIYALIYYATIGTCFIIMFVWIISYCITYKSQIRAEQIITCYYTASPYLPNEANTGAIMVEHIKEIQKANLVVIQSNRDNSTLIFDWQTPDWIAPEVVKTPFIGK